MKRAAALLILTVTLPALANEGARMSEGEARFQASEVQLRCGGALAGLDGLTSVNIAGSGTDYRLIIVVRDLEAKFAARALLGGDVYGGVKVMWSVSNPAAARPVAARPAPAPAPRPYTAPPPTRNYTPVAAPVEMRRTFWAGPATLTNRRYDYARSSNCHPSRYGFLVSRPSTGYGTCRTGGSTSAYSFGGGASCASVAR